MSRRVEQLASSIQQLLGEALNQGLNDPRIRGLVSVTSVEVTPDRKLAFVKVSVFPAEGAPSVLEGLSHASGRLKMIVRGALRCRVVPNLMFRLDESLKKQAEVLGLIQSVVDPSESASSAGQESGK